MEENHIVEPLHPLQNVDILELIFKKLPFKALLSSRQVCRAWRQHSSKAIQAISHAAFDYRKRTSAMSKFLHVLEDTKNIFSKELFIMSRYTIRNLHAHEVRFWEICGRSVKILGLDEVSFPSVDSFRHAIFQSCPNLKTLHLGIVQVCGDNAQEPLEWVPPQFPPNGNLKNLRVFISKDIRGLGITWMEILSHFPSLESLDASLVFKTGDELFRSLALCRMHNPKRWELKTLKIHLTLLEKPLETAELLLQSKFALDSLELRGFGEQDEMTAIENILSSQSATLTNLKLGICKDDMTPWREILPLRNYALFGKLTRLSMCSCPLRSTRFLRFMPNLKSLELNCIEPEFENDETEEDPWVHDNCTELELYLSENFGVADLRHLQKRLPNIEQLRISKYDNNNELFSVVCEFWSGVRSLKLEFGDVDDVGISGLDLEDVNRMNEEVNWRPITAPRANLSALKGLQKFLIRYHSKSTFNPERVFFFDGDLQVNWAIRHQDWRWIRSSH